MEDAEAKRRRLGCVDEARLLVGVRGADRTIGDVGVAELRIGEERVVGLEQPLVASPVHVQRPLGLDHLVGVEVGVHVGSAEGVDRLLGVADQHEGRVAGLAEGAVHDVPLHRVGVLELVDQDDVVALPQTGAGHRAAHVVEQGAAQPEQDVVVRHDLERLLATLHLLAHGFRETPADGRQVLLLREGRDDVRIRMVEHELGDLQGLFAAELERVRPRGELPEIEVVHDLLHQIADVLDQGDLPVDVAGGPQPVEDLEAEPVRGLDGRRVEVGDRLAETVTAGLDLGPVPLGQQEHDLVVFVAARTVEHVDQAVERPHQAVAHALAELARRHAGEGDDEEPVDGQDALGDVARGQGGDGERLARPGAGLQQRHPKGELAADVEGLRIRVGPHQRHHHARLADVSLVHHLLVVQETPPQPVRVDTERVVSPGSQSSSSWRGPPVVASRSSKETASPNTNLCSGFRSSCSKLKPETQESRAAANGSLPSATASAQAAEVLL